MFLKQKKGGIPIQLVGVVVLGLAGAVILGAIVATILSGIQTGQTANSLAYNITGYGLTGIANVFSQFGTLGTIIGAGALLGGLALLGVGAVAGYQYFKNR